MKIITNEEFEIAVNNEEYWKVMDFAAREALGKFTMDEDDLYTCKLEGLWKAMLKYNGRKKFTSYLYDRTRWVCFAYLKNKYKQRFHQLRYHPASHYESYWELLDTIENLPDKELFKQRYLDGTSLKDIAKNNNLTKYKARAKIKNSSKELIKIIND